MQVTAAKSELGMQIHPPHTSTHSMCDTAKPKYGVIVTYQKKTKKHFLPQYFWVLLGQVCQINRQVE